MLVLLLLSTCSGVLSFIPLDVSVFCNGFDELEDLSVQVVFDCDDCDDGRSFLKNFVAALNLNFI